MKLTLPTKYFRDALSKLSSIPGAHGGSPYTQALRLEAGMGGLIISRFTSEAKITVTLDDGVEIDDDSGTPYVDITSLTALVSRLSAASLSITSDEKNLHMVSGRAKAKLAIFGDEIEAQPPADEMETESIRLAIDELRGFVHFAAVATSQDGVRPAFCGVCIRMIGENLAFVASDGKSVHIALSDYSMPVDCIIANGSIDAFLKATSGEIGACTLSIGENMASIIGSNVEMSFTMVNEKFPNVEPFLNQPESSIESKISVSKDALSEALKTCSAVGRGESKFVTWDVTKKAMRISASNDRDSEMDVSLECASTKADKIGVPSLQLATALEMMEADDKGEIQLLHYSTPSSLLVRQADKIAFVALAKA